MLVLCLGYSHLYRNFCKCLYIELYHLSNPVRFNFASKYAALRSAALRFLVSSCMEFSKTLHEKAFHQVWINVLRPFSATQGNPAKQDSLHASPNLTHEDARQEC